MTEQQFLRQIKRLLHCKADKKREILRQLESDIASAKEGGKSWEEIRQEWGTPEQFVSEFNEDGRSIQKGKRILIGSVAVLVLFACVAAGVWFAHSHEKNSGQQLTKNVETQKIEKIPDVVREVITDFSDGAYEKFIARCDAKMQAAFSKKNWEVIKCDTNHSGRTEFEGLSSGCRLWQASDCVYDFSGYRKFNCRILF